MALTYSTAAKTARMTAVRDMIDEGPPLVKAQLKIYTSGLATLLATFQLRRPCGIVTDDVLTFDVAPGLSATVTADGEAAEAKIVSGENDDVISGLTVGTSGADITLDSVNITAALGVTLVTGTITHAA